jgi:hypothetical protein
MKLPRRATGARIVYSPDVHISFPSWTGARAWDVWNSRRHTQGAECVRHGVTFSIAEACALEIVARLKRDDEGRIDTTYDDDELTAGGNPIRSWE